MYLDIIILVGFFIISCLLAPIMARLFDKATYALGNWLFKQFPTSGIIKSSHEHTRQKYSCIYIPKPIKNAVSHIFRPLKRGNRVIKKSESTSPGKKTYKNPLSDQPLNVINNPLLEFEANNLSKTFHVHKSTTREIELTNDMHKVNK